MKFVNTSLYFLYIGTILFANTNAEKRNIRGLADKVSDPKLETPPTTVEILVDETNIQIEGKEIVPDDTSAQSDLVVTTKEEKQELQEDIIKPEDYRQLSYNTGTVSSIDIIGKGATPVVPVVVYEKESRPHYGGYSGGYYGKGKGKGGRYGYGGGYYGNYYGSYYGKGKGKGGRYYYGGGQRQKYTDTTVVKEVVEVGKGAW
jgi:hypothetical protein